VTDEPTPEDPMPSIEDLLARPEPAEGAVTPATIQQLVAGAVDPAAVGDLRRRIAADPESQARFDALVAQERAFDAAHPWESVRDAVVARAAELPALDDEGILRGFAGARPVSRAPAAPWWRGLVPALIGVATAIVVFLALPGPPPAPDGPNRIKSGEGLHGFALVEGHAQPLAAGETLGEGDRLQLQVTTTRGRLALLGVDGTGTVTRYFPVAGEVSAPWTPGAARPLPDSLVLDDAPGPEIFVAFASDDALPLDALQQALHDALDAGGGSRALLTTDWGGVDLDARVHVFHVEKRAE